MVTRYRFISPISGYGAALNNEFDQAIFE